LVGCASTNIETTDDRQSVAELRHPYLEAIIKFDLHLNITNDSPDSSRLALLKFILHKTDWYGLSNNMMRVFEMIAFVIAGKPVAMGEHEPLAALLASTRDPAPVPQP
jgi:hypothetical protein